MHEVGVIYLYRFAEGEHPVLRFLESYRRHPAGIDHDLYVVFKGFPDQASLAAGRALFAEIPFTSIELDDSGYDIGSYLRAAKIASSSRLIFLNTFSQIVGNNWLRCFDRAFKMNNVGLVGATGSWQANTSSYEAALVNLMRYGWRSLGKWPKQSSKFFGYNDAGELNLFPGRERRPSVGDYFLAPFEYIRRFYEYGRFPNPHIRTNAFMIERELFLSLNFPVFASKQDVYRFESGRKSLTRQVLAIGLKPVVVGRDGAVYEISEWRLSSTFWTNEQDNLVVADNRTSDYAQAQQLFRRRLENDAWIHPWSWTSR